MDSIKSMKEQNKKINDWTVVDYNAEAKAQKKVFDPTRGLNADTSLVDRLGIRLQYLNGFKLSDKEREHLTKLKESIPTKFVLKTQDEIKKMSKGDKKNYKKNLDKYEEWMSKYNDITLRQRAYSSRVADLLVKNKYDTLDIAEDMDVMDEELERNDERFNNEDYNAIVDITYAQAVNSDSQLDGAINSYRNLNYRDIKSSLDSGHPNGDGMILINGMRYAELPMDMVTARGADVDEFSKLLDGVEGFKRLSFDEKMTLLEEKLNNKEEIIFSNKKPMSTSRNMDVALDFLNRKNNGISKGLMFVVLNKKGTNAIDISLKDRQEGKMFESEVLLAPGCKYKIIGMKLVNGVPQVYISTQNDGNIYDGSPFLKRNTGETEEKKGKKIKR